VNISGANSTSYTTPATTVADYGTQYRCIVSNAFGADTTTPRFLFVFAAPDIVANPQSTTVVAPAAGVFDSEADRTPAIAETQMLYRNVRCPPEGAVSYKQARAAEVIGYEKH
jgi:hypothetical protein